MYSYFLPLSPSNSLSVYSYFLPLSPSSSLSMYSCFLPLSHSSSLSMYSYFLPLSPSSSLSMYIYFLPLSPSSSLSMYSYFLPLSPSSSLSMYSYFLPLSPFSSLSMYSFFFAATVLIDHRTQLYECLILFLFARYICLYSNFSCAYHDFSFRCIRVESLPLSLMLPAIPPLFYVNILSLPIFPSPMHTLAPTILLSNTNGNGLSADLLCKNTAIGNSAETPHAVLTLVSLMFRCTFIQPISHLVWDPFLPPWAPSYHLSGYYARPQSRNIDCCFVLTFSPGSASKPHNPYGIRCSDSFNESKLHSIDVNNLVGSPIKSVWWCSDMS